jgi:hypothetical protein
MPFTITNSINLFQPFSPLNASG